MKDLSDVEEARAFIRRMEKKRAYSACRGYLPGLLREKHPDIYKALMAELMETYARSLEIDIETRLRLLPNVHTFAEKVRKIKFYEKERRKTKKGGINGI